MADHARDDTVGFVGLGMMGAPMAANILRKGFPLVVHDRHPQACDGLAAEGAGPCDTPAAVADRARTIVVMVDTTAQVEEVIFGPQGIHAAARSGDVVLCMSTIDPAAARRFARTLADRDIGLIDSPVAGMQAGAIAGTLRAYVGGEADVLASCRPVLEAMATTIVHIGGPGQGLAMKLVNNMLCQVGWVAASEALAVGAKAGLDRAQMVELLCAASGDSAALRYLGPRWLKRDFDGIRLDITYKDMQHQIDMGKALGVPMPMANTAQQIYEMARCKGYGDEDGVAVIKVYEELAGLNETGHRG